MHFQRIKFRSAGTVCCPLLLAHTTCKRARCLGMRVTRATVRIRMRSHTSNSPESQEEQLARCVHARTSSVVLASNNTTTAQHMQAAQPAPSMSNRDHTCMHARTTWYVVLFAVFTNPRQCSAGIVPVPLCLLTNDTSDTTALRAHVIKVRVVCPWAPCALETLRMTEHSS